jgi:hypothetical protein
MPKPPASTKTSLAARLREHARTRWPQLDAVQVRFRAEFAYIDGDLGEGEVLKLCRLRYGGSATSWGFAIYRASHDDYQDSILPRAAHSPAAPNTPSTAPADSTSATPPPGPRPSPIHRRTNRQHH